MSAEVITVESRSNIIDASHVMRNYSLLVIIGLMILIGSSGSIRSFGGFPFFQLPKTPLQRQIAQQNQTKQ
jgi:hypothetical protein